MGYVIKQKEIPMSDGWDVIVAGGGPAGCAAAIAAGRSGLKTLLIEATGCLGGMGTMGLVPAWCPFTDHEKVVYRGIAEEIFAESKAAVDHAKDEDFDWVPIDPEALKVILDTKVTEAGAEVLFNTMLCDVDVTDGHVDTIVVSNKSGLSAYKAKVYIDCTGDADLAAWAGAEFIKGDGEGNLQPATHCFEVSNIDEYAYRNGPWLHPHNENSPIHQIVKSGRYDIPDVHLCNNIVYPGTVGFNGGHIWDVDNTDPMSVSRALIKGRRLANELLRALKEYQPKTFANAKLAMTAPLMGVRESRRIVGDYILCVQDYIDRRTFDDEICRNSYYLDVHLTKEEAKKKNEGIKLEDRSMRYAKGESHGVPYRCLTPKGLKNVYVAGRSISTDRPVQGSTRVMPVCMAMGEAAGTASGLAIKTGDVHNIDVDELRATLLKNGAYIK